VSGTVLNILFKQIFEYLRFVVRRFVQDRCLMVAGSLTYTTLLALVPLLTVTVTLTAHVPAVRDLVLQLKTFITKNLLPEVAGRVITTYMEQFANNAAKLTLIGTIIVVVTAVALMFTIDGAFNEIWRTRRRRNWWARLLAYGLLLSVGPVLVGASLAITSYLVHWMQRFETVLPLLDDVLLRLVPFTLTTVVLVLAYRTIPCRLVPTRHAIAGGIFAALLFELTKHFFFSYVSNLSTYSLIYGTFASVPIFLGWLFCCWVVVLIGAEVTATFSYFRHMDAQKADANSRFVAAKRMVDALAARGSSGEPPVDFAALRRLAPMPIDYAEDILDHLLAAEVIVEAEGDATMPAATRTGKSYQLREGDMLIDDTLIRRAVDVA
jgi:membrane protein